MFTSSKALVIPEGNVVRIECDGVVLWNARRIPSIYQEVEWVAVNADVKAYIDLSFAFDTQATIEMSTYATEHVNTYIFGAVENDGILRCCLSLPYSNTTGTGSLYGSDGNQFIGISNVPYSPNTEEHYIFEYKKGALRVENKAHNYNYTYTLQAEYTMTSNLYLFAQNYNGSPRFGGLRRVGYFRYYDKNSELICDLVPCYRKSDGVIGMYDVVRNIFLTNVGSGTFIKGADV